LKYPNIFVFYDEGKILATNKAESDNNIGFILVAIQQQLNLYTQKDELIDALGQASGISKNISTLSITGRQVIVKAESGLHQVSDDFFDWVSITPLIQPQWLTATEEEMQQTTHAEILYQSQYLTVERLILDARSGRLLDNFGVFFMALSRYY